MSGGSQFLVLASVLAASWATVALWAYAASRGAKRPWLLGVTVATIQFAQYVLAAWPGVDFWGVKTPLSVAVFPVNLSLILLVYAKRGVYELRTLLLVHILIVNLLLAAVLTGLGLLKPVFGWSCGAIGSGAACLTLLGCGLVFVDAVLMAALYDRAAQAPRWLRLTVALAPPLMLDAAGFALALHQLRPDLYPNLGLVLAGQLVGKMIGAAVCVGGLLIYARRAEPDLFLDCPDRLSGWGFLARLLGGAAGWQVLPARPLGLPDQPADTLAFVEQLDVALAESVNWHRGSVGVAVVPRPADPKQAMDALRQFARGRFSAGYGRFGGGLVLAIYGLERERLAAILDEVRAKFGIPTNHTWQLADDGRRDSSAKLLRQLLATAGLPTTGVPGPAADVPADRLAADARRTLAERWAELKAIHTGRWVAFHGDRLLGTDDSPHRLFERYATADRPAERLLVARVADGLADYFPELVAAGVEPAVVSLGAAAAALEAVASPPATRTTPPPSDYHI